MAVAAALVVGTLPIALDAYPGADTPVANAELIETFTPPAFVTNTNGAIDTVATRS